MNTKLFKAVIIVLASLAIACSALFAACGEEETSWNVSESGNVTASLSDNGKYGFILTVEGSGEMSGYASKKDAPWYGKSGRITDVVISDGVTKVGGNAFSDCNINTVVLPQSVVSIGENAFPSNTFICAYSPVNAADGVRVYLYSESKPVTSGDFWRYENGVAVAWQAVKDTPTKVLFIGNSFTFYSNIPELFANIATEAGEQVTVESVTCGSHTLEQFADPTDEYGKQVDEKLKASDNYDVVVIQEHSTRPLTDYDAFLEGARALKAQIDATQTNCRVVLYSTWGYASGAASRNMTIPEMEAELRKAYDNAAKALNAEVSHVGTAFSTVYLQYPDMMNADSSDNAFNLYYSDNKHPSYTGAFLSACVHVATILDCDPRNSSFTGELDKATTDYLKNTAYETVFVN